jgi:hypothetical protein
MSSVRPHLAALAFTAVAACGGSTPPPAQTASAQPATSAAASAPAPGPSSASWPANLPPLPEVSFAPARPMPVVEEVFRFAAEHPEVLSHIPCFCGCENRGHKDNDDCFVAERNDKGRVTKWEPHGMG